MADEGGIYAEDIVKNSRGTLGLVVQDAEETSDESDSEDEALKKGQLLVCWYPSGNEETITISKVQLADRSLLPGDVVKHADPNNSKQKGYVGDVEVVASVKVLAANQVVTNVDCKELQPLQELIPGVHVTLGPWLGVITESNQRVTLKMKNGSRCCLEGEQTEMLYDMSDQRDEDSPFYSEAFYPGQVIAGPSKVFKEARWLSGVKPIMHSQSQMKGTIEESKVISCEVNWQICGACGPGEECSVLVPPDVTVTEDLLSRLKVVNHYRHASIQIGDKAFYTVKAKDLELAANSLAGNPSSLEPLPIGENQAQRTNSGQTDNCLSPLSDPNAQEESSTWQEEQKKSHPQGVVSDSTDADDDGDGGEHKGHKAKGAHSSQGSKHESSGGAPSARYPAKRKRKRAKRKRKATPHMEVKVGDRVCVEITSTSTTVDVIWQDKSKSTEVLSTDLVPVFHLDEHEFFPGDYVSDQRVTADATIYGTVLTTNCASRTCDVKWFTREGNEISVERDVSVYDIAEHTDFVFNSGDIVVRMVPPDYCTSPITAAPSASTPCVGQVTNVDEDGNVFIRWVDDTQSRVIPQELYKVDTEDDDQSIAMADGSQNNSDDEWETASDVSSDEASHDQDDIIIANSAPDVDDEEEREQQNAAENKDKMDYNALNEMLSNRNPAFMILDAIPDNHAFKPTTFNPGNRRKIMTVIQRELGLLHSSLPSGILVRSFEERVDLFRVMITGPPGTPYEHGLFLFDVRLPPDYPSSPPVFHYLSMCSGRLNPNLYEDGKVCVSLLGTWSGKGSEVWTPKSSVLQVLISIQGLILSSEPYYNEAGYEKQRGTQEGLENSRLYNEMVILKLLQSMATMISRPPAGFETEIRQHFIEHVPKLVEKLNFWLEHNKELTDAEVCNGAQCDATGATQEDRPKIVKERNLEDQKPQVDQSQVRISQEDQNGLVGESAQEKQTETEEKVPEQGAESSESSPSKQRTSPHPQGAHNSSNDPFKLPEFPLFPLSKGFRKSLESCLQHLKSTMEAHNLPPCVPVKKCQ